MAVSEGNWYALYVKSRNEFIVSGELHRKGIETFLPSATKLSQWKDRRKHVEVPLFPGYLFVHVAANPEEFLRVVKTRGAVTLLSLNPGCPTPVAPEEIYSLRIILQSGEKVDIYPHLKEGMRVRVRRGALMGAEGILTRKHDKHMLLVNLELLGRSVAVSIYTDDVEAA